MNRSNIMYIKRVYFSLVLVLVIVNNLVVGNPVIHHKWTRTEIMDTNGLFLLEWRLEQKDIVFKVTVNTRGFIGLGFSHKTGKMAGSDLVLAWVDDRTGKPNVLVSEHTQYTSTTH